MNRPIAILIMCALALVLGSGGALAGKDDDAPDKEGFARFSKSPLPRGTVEPGRGLVYVLRPTSMAFTVKSWFLCDDEPLGVNRGSSYFFASVEPGPHVFWSKSENVDALELEVEAGKTYYIQQQVRMGGVKARTKLEVLSDAEGERLLAKCNRHSTLTDIGRARGLEIAREHRHATEKDLDRREKAAKRKGN